MKKNLSILMVLLMAFAMILSACGGDAETPAEEPEQTEQEGASQSEADSEVVTMYVGPELVDCEGEGPQKCMLIKYSPDEEYQLFYSNIDGFNFEPGYEYELKVMVTSVENPPAGGSSLNYSLVEEVSKTPVSTESESTGEMGEGDVVTMYVGPELAECTGAGPQTCMLVKYAPDEEYQYFYDQIEGFEYEPGYNYELKVSVAPVENPPADGSSLNYTLVEEVSKTSANAEGDVVTMYVGPELAECTGAGPQMCMLVKYEPSADYQYFYNQIEGFEFEPGYNYELQVLVTEVENPPADGSSLQYTLIEEVSKTPAGEEGSMQSESMVEGDASLTGPTWTLDAYIDADGNMVNVLPETEITAVFGEDGSLGGSSGCNNYNTSYEADGSNIKVNEMIAATMMMCPEPVMQQETAYLANLTAAATFEIAGDTLTLNDANGNPMAVFTAQQPTPLVGTNWEVTRYNNGKGGVTTVINETTITAVFDEDGTLSGNASCNTYNASYETDGNNITIGIGMTTMMACPGEGVMEQETAYMAALGTVATYSIQGDTLELRTADGALAVSYIAADPLALTSMFWQVTSYNNGRGGAVSPIINTVLNMEFMDDGTVTGNAGCNRYFGPVSEDGENINIGPLSTTRAFCPEPEGVMDQEQEFLTALQLAATYTIRDGKLDLRTAEGSIAVIAIPGEPETFE